MTPLLPLEITTTKFRNRKRKSKEPKRDTRADYFDATCEVNEPSMEPLVDLQTSQETSQCVTSASFHHETSQYVMSSSLQHDTSLSSTDESSTWQEDDQSMINQVSLTSDIYFSGQHLFQWPGPGPYQKGGSRHLPRGRLLCQNITTLM